MTKLPTIPKGTRDYSPEIMAKRNYIFETVKSVFVKYGYMPIEIPVMENLSTFMGKYGDEGDKLIFMSPAPCARGEIGTPPESLMGSAVLISIFFINVYFASLSSPSSAARSLISAIAPATCGVAMLVPLMLM